MADEAQGKDSAEVTDNKKGSKAKFILIPVILLAQAAIAYFLVGSVLTDTPAEPEKKPRKKPQANSVGEFFEIKDLVINPAGTLGRRYLVLELGLETHEPQLLVEAESKTIWIRDAVIVLLTAKPSDELLDITRRDALKREILDTVNSKLTTGKFEKLYFTKYIMQ